MHIFFEYSTPLIFCASPVYMLIVTLTAVSYTHLDVYKRQSLPCACVPDYS